MGTSEWVKRGPGKSNRRLLEGLALAGAALLLIVGVVAFLQSRANEKLAADANVPVSATPAPTTPDQVTSRGGSFPPGARKVAVEFLRTTLARERLAVAWELASPEVRAGVTRAQWLAGQVTVPPFPVADLEASGFNVNASGPNKVVAQVLLVPEPDTGYVVTRYDITLERANSTAPWRVTYCQPYAPPGKYAPAE